jgi:uncharacterized protein
VGSASSQALSQRQRILVLAITLLCLTAVALIVDGTALPRPGAHSLWFYSACLSLLLGDLVVEPWYTRPADAVANGTAVLLATLTASQGGLEVSEDVFALGRATCIAVAVSLIVVAIAAMLSRQQGVLDQPKRHKYAFVLASTFGRARVLFGAFFAVTAAAAYADHPDDLMVLYLAGGLLLWTQPIRGGTERILRIAASEAPDDTLLPSTGLLNPARPS